MGDQNIERLIRQFCSVWLQDDQIIRELVDALDAQEQVAQVQEDDGAPIAVNRAGNIVHIGTRVQILTPVKICGWRTVPYDTHGTITDITAHHLTVRAESDHSKARVHHNVLKIQEQP